MHARQAEAASLPLMRDYCRKFPASSNKMRLKLAQVLLRDRQKPVAAMRVLEEIPAGVLAGPLEATRAKLIREEPRRCGRKVCWNWRRGVRLAVPGSPVSIDLNADLGEGFPWDIALLDRVSSASVSCGLHAGDPAAILATLRAAKSRGVTLAPIPAIPTARVSAAREDSPGGEVEGLILDQWAPCAGWPETRCVGPLPQTPRGPLQPGPAAARNRLRGRDRRPPNAWPPRARAARRPGRPRSRAVGVPVLAEGFADRGYRDDGALVPRGEPGAMLDDPEESRPRSSLARSGRMATLCIHGDEPGAVALADRVRLGPGSHRIERGVSWMRGRGIEPIRVDLRPGPLATVQDRGTGRVFGHGASRLRPRPPRSAAIANAMLGNDPGFAVVELTGFGGVFEAESTLAVSIPGLPCPPVSNGSVARPDPCPFRPRRPSGPAIA